jgi:uncharacterized lipoprotein
VISPTVNEYASDDQKAGSAKVFSYAASDGLMSSSVTGSRLAARSENSNVANSGTKKYRNPMMKMSHAPAVLRGRRRRRSGSDAATVATFKAIPRRSVVPVLMIAATVPSGVAAPCRW